MNGEGGFRVEWDGLFATVILSVQFVYEINRWIECAVFLFYRIGYQK
jgi:hypothetical protein